MNRWISTLALAGTLLPAILATPVAQAHAQGPTDCRFVLGFATLRSMLSAQVGDCLQNQQTNLANGDAYQRTSGGLLVWRKRDNWTAFTDGYRTWLNGPRGLQQRLNVQRFAWEGDANAPGTTLLAEGGGVAAGASVAITQSSGNGQGNSALRQRVAQDRVKQMEADENDRRARLAAQRQVEVAQQRQAELRDTEQRRQEEQNRLRQAEQRQAERQAEQRQAEQRNSR